MQCAVCSKSCDFGFNGEQNWLCFKCMQTNLFVGVRCAPIYTPNMYISINAENPKSISFPIYNKSAAMPECAPTDTSLLSARPLICKHYDEFHCLLRAQVCAFHLVVWRLFPVCCLDWAARVPTNNISPTRANTRTRIS